jgi:hypothetical protein
MPTRLSPGELVSCLMVLTRLRNMVVMMRSCLACSVFLGCATNDILSLRGLCCAGTADLDQRPVASYGNCVSLFRLYSHPWRGRHVSVRPRSGELNALPSPPSPPATTVPPYHSKKVLSPPNLAIVRDTQSLRCGNDSICHLGQRVRRDINLAK